MDDLTRIKGIGKATARKLAEAGIDSFEKLARFAEFPELASTVEVEAEWIAEAARILHESSEGSPPVVAGAPTPAAAADAAGATAEAGQPPAAADQPADNGSAGTNNPPSETEGGAGQIPAGPAGGEPGKEAWIEFQELDEVMAKACCPLLVAALRHWAEAAGDDQAHLVAGPVVRIRATREGFRRAGMAHPREAVEHAALRFTPDQVEQLLAEPNLIVELV